MIDSRAAEELVEAAAVALELAPALVREPEWAWSDSRCHTRTVR